MDCLVNYNFDPKDWWLEYEFDPIVYDRSDDGIERTFTAKQIRRTENKGNVDADKLGHLIEFYDELPHVFLWGKSNIFKYISKEEFDKVAKNQEFTPLLTQNHKTYSDQHGVVCYYQGGIYYERNSDWIPNNPDLASSGRFSSWVDWANEFQLPKPAYLPFAPGGNYLLTRERVHRYSRDYYARMRETLLYAQNPMEAHLAERSYYLLWQ